MDSNNNHIDDDAIIEQIVSQQLTQLTFSNLITVLNQHDTAELESFIKSPERLYYILLYLGIPKDLLHTPAYRQLLEEILCEALNTIIKSNYSIAGFIKYDSNCFKLEIGSSIFVTDSFSLSKTEDGYKIYQHSFHNGTKSESSKTINLYTKKKIIYIQESTSKSIPDPKDLYKNQILRSSKSYRNYTRFKWFCSYCKGYR